ncbi:glycosyl hydrolase [Oculatella sp. LEGE 06141]|uniref:glycosyl hydrolase family 8 n=1 Tax=Oculatella sp. LEGE 06141 TaxID=1828648 RepID=UPI001881D41F|nr:glycosyl hydrolase family 8 [Oculatella sp. LEGE 06141]MBE9182397.1 glycosyl hydrolase [Oculatella sp. LEGE 06141]
MVKSIYRDSSLRFTVEGGTWPCLILLTLLSGLALSGCDTRPPSAHQPDAGNGSAAASAAVRPMSTDELLQQSWHAYKQRFIQADGRVIDREAGDRSTSEGQAYAMLRAVFMNDPTTFDRTLNWAEANLQRRAPDGSQSDRLWVWKWGQQDRSNWGVIDANFASDGDLDAITALILASRQWNRPDYLALARGKLHDLWTLATVAGNGNRHYFLPGPKQVFQPEADRLYLNPSYLGTYAFRLFAQVDSEHDWLSLVESSYWVLNESAHLSRLSLPSDWVALNLRTTTFEPMDHPHLKSIYGFDAYRVWWRVSLDAAWFGEPRARRYLQQHLPALQSMWQSAQAEVNSSRPTIPAQFDLDGQPLVSYDSIAQYATLYAAFEQIDPAIAAEIRQQKLMPAYRDGFWDNDSAYYTQNLSWFGLISSTDIATRWLQP